MWQYGPYGYGMMGSWGGGFWPFHGIIWVLVIAVVVVAVVWLLRATARASGPRYITETRSSAGLAVLEERYARGEINRDEFLQKKKDIGG